MAHCNACTLAELKRKYGARLIRVAGSWYLRGQTAAQGQAQPHTLADGTPIRFVARFESERHSRDGDCSR